MTNNQQKPAELEPKPNPPKPADSITLASILALESVLRCVAKARKRITDGRAREAMAILEHELIRELSEVSKVPAPGREKSK